MVKTFVSVIDAIIAAEAYSDTLPKKSIVDIKQNGPDCVPASHVSFALPGVPEHLRPEGACADRLPSCDDLQIVNDNYTIVTTALKHLPGGHDQMTHGTWAHSGLSYVNIADSPVAFAIKYQLEDAKLPDGHYDGLSEIKFQEDQLIRSEYQGKITEAYGIYMPSERTIVLASNADNIHVIGGGTIIHEIGHNVHLAKVTDAAAGEWAGLSDNGQRARISSYARKCQGEHFAEAYRAYGRGGTYRAKLRNIEPASYAYMRRLFAKDSKYLLPEGMYASLDNFWTRYNPAGAPQ